ncbi:hypothetical protein [endosymbiont of unidentified scaly snail isolate Monju]|uniref:hypothetical protein n=1 Tax=endosymbiont of unidentified scaly snail isolate Monju TaxID=1248727 RepID=UPI000389271E|nr:hypothetical protein [endosymbiont of unidentified scaly snail isolate Monju]BAN68955.1 conserved hypothetical protein [endosymbiont of unidentified scaly snail isolate Monju]
MAKKKSVDEMTAQELYELAKAKEAEEQERQREAMRAELEKAKAERKALLARHRKELAAIDARIRELGGRVRSTGGKSGGRGRVSNTVLEILSDRKEHSTTDLKAELAKHGVVANNLNQTLAYLKRQGKIKSPKRSTYVIA